MAESRVLREELRAGVVSSVSEQTEARETDILQARGTVSLIFFSRSIFMKSRLNVWLNRNIE